MDDMTNRRKTKWITIKYDDNDKLVPSGNDGWNVDTCIDICKRIWGIPSSWVMPDDMRRNVEMLMYDQIQGSRVVDGVGGGQGRGAYDWNAHIDIASNTVQLPLVGFDDIDKNARFVLDKQGLHLANEDDIESLTWDELKDMIKMKIRSWASISLIYSIGGIADSIRLGDSTPSKLNSSDANSKNTDENIDNDTSGDSIINDTANNDTDDTLVIS